MINGFLKFIGTKLRGLFRNGAVEDELHREMSFHLDMLTNENIENGMDPESAQKAALKEFGNVEAFKENSRESLSIHWLMGMVREFRLGLRLLWKSKGFTITVTLTLAICIAGNTVVFSVLDAILKPPAYPDSNKVVEIINNYPGLHGPYKKLGGAASPGAFWDYSENADAFESMAFVQLQDVNVSIDEVLLRARGMFVTKEFFDIFEREPLLGRYFVDDDFLKNKHEDSSILYAAVLSESFWKNKLGGDREILGRTVYLNSTPNVIIGIAPDKISNHVWRPDLYRALTPIYRMTENQKLRQRFRDFGGILGRLKVDVDKNVAKAQIDTLNRRFLEHSANPKEIEFVKRSQHETKVVTYLEVAKTNDGPSLYLLQLSALLVLHIACFSVASLLVARGIQRRPEFAIRSALGASQLVLFRQIFMECIAIAFVSGILGIVLTSTLFELVNNYNVSGLFSDYHPEIILQLNKNTNIFLSFITLFVGVLLGLVSFISLAFTRRKLLAPIHEGTRNATSSKSMRSLRTVLVSSQVALTVVLLIGAGLLIKSFIETINTDPGISSKNVYVSKVSLNWADWPGADQIAEFRRRLKASLLETPGIESVSYSYFVPVADQTGVNGTISIHHAQDGATSDFVSTNAGSVSEGFFETLGIQLLAGRYFDESDLGREGGTIIIDKAFVEKYFDDVNPLQTYLSTQAISDSSSFDPANTPIIIGIVENIKQQGLDGAHGAWRAGELPMLYVLIGNNSRRLDYTILVKSMRPQNEVREIIQEKVREIDPRLPVYLFQSLDSTIMDSLNQRRVNMLLVATLSSMALVLSTLGIYGVIAFDVTQRTSEIGLRVAVGATPQQILKLILQQGAVKVVGGLIIGLMAAYLFSDRISRFLFQVEPTEPSAFIAVSIFVLGIAFLASYLPARRASRIQPMEALRTE